MYDNPSGQLHQRSITSAFNYNRTYSMLIMLPRLAVTRPRAAVTGGREKHVNLGDRVSIACELRDSGDEQQPEFVFW